MLAARQSDVDALNDAAQQRLHDAGRLYGAPIEVGGRSYHVGDEVLCLINDRRHSVLNGTTARIDAINGNTIHATTSQGSPVALGRTILGTVLRLTSCHRMGL